MRLCRGGVSPPVKRTVEDACPYKLGHLCANKVCPNLIITLSVTASRATSPGVRGFKCASIYDCRLIHADTKSRLYRSHRLLAVARSHLPLPKGGFKEVNSAPTTLSQKLKSFLPTFFQKSTGQQARTRDVSMYINLSKSGADSDNCIALTKSAKNDADFCNRRGRET